VSDIFREVDEELKQDQYKKLWKKFGPGVIGVVVVIVATVGGYQAWQAWDLDRRLDQSDRYAAAMALQETGSIEAAEEALVALVEPEGDGYGLLAAFEQARLRVELGDSAGAIALWDQIAGNESAGDAFRGMADLLSVMHQIDDGDAAALEARLQPLTEVGSAFRPSALELTAVLALRQGDTARARELYTAVADDRSAPPALRTRATQMLEALDG